MVSYVHIHQFKQAEETALKLDLDGLVVIGGDDSNTNACLLAENFRYTAREQISVDHATSFIFPLLD